MRSYVGGGRLSDSRIPAAQRDASTLRVNLRACARPCHQLDPAQLGEQLGRMRVVAVQLVGAVR
ncbi:hypothetical protein GCM10020220_018250 [Nonomuraea rubra]|uniref:hypothetical protein n=1 Tax=Nonomuraea rubra TaxID=46180 RepID=UPI0031EBE306